MTYDHAVAHLIDHTILKPEATREDVCRVCAEARLFGVASVCVNPYRIPLVASELRNSGVKVCSVVGFPLGASTTAVKAAEALDALDGGAHEIDMVLNIGALCGGEDSVVAADIHALARVCHERGAILKVIIETCLLTRDLKRAACRLSVAAGADFVKTSTGFGKGGATVEDVALMRAEVGPAIGVKASGGIRTLADLRAMVAAGASRIGASATRTILEQAARELATQEAAARATGT